MPPASWPYTGQSVCAAAGLAATITSATEIRMVFWLVDTREWPLYSDRRYLFGPPTNGVGVTSFSGGTMKTLLAFALAVALLAAQNAPAPKPKRINRAIELI